MNPAKFELDATQTGGTKFLDENHDTVAWLHSDLLPPIGTTVLLEDGTQRSIQAVTLDLSNESRLAQIFVQLGPAM